MKSVFHAAQNITPNYTEHYTILDMETITVSSQPKIVEGRVQVDLRIHIDFLNTLRTRFSPLKVWFQKWENPS